MKKDLSFFRPLKTIDDWKRLHNKIVKIAVEDSEIYVWDSDEDQTYVFVFEKTRIKRRI